MKFLLPRTNWNALKLTRRVCPSGIYPVCACAAKGLQITAPPAYNRLLLSSTANGINFAEGGSGVFESPTGEFGIDRLSVQIQRFEDVVAQGLYSADQISSSFTLLAISGNDYNAFSKDHGFDDLSVSCCFALRLDRLSQPDSVAQDLCEFTEIRRS